MTNNQLPPEHPGYIIKRLFTSESGLSPTVRAVAKILNVSHPTVIRLINKKNKLTLKLAKKLALATNISVDTWLDIQKNWDLYNKNNTSNAKVKKLAAQKTKLKSLNASKKQLNQLHPGFTIKKIFTSEIGLTPTAQGLAKLLHVSSQTIQNLFNGKSGITLNLAVKLAFITKTRVEKWLNMQRSWDLYKLETQKSLLTKRLKPLTDNQLQGIIKKTKKEKSLPMIMKK